MINRSKVRDRRFWRRWCKSGAVSNVDGLCVDFWMIKRFRPTVQSARVTIYFDGKPIGHLASFTPVVVPEPSEDAPPVIESTMLTFRRLPRD